MVRRLCTVLALAFIQSLVLSDDVSFTMPSLSNDAKEAGTERQRRRIHAFFPPLRTSSQPIIGGIPGHVTERQSPPLRAVKTIASSGSHDKFKGAVPAKAAAGPADCR